SSGETTGIFQLESKGMKDLSTKLKPETFEDIIALMALYRPGPIGSGMVDEFVNRKHNKSNIEYDIEELKDILKETYGVILYQEQVMQIARKLANFSPVDADILRKAMGKKNPIEMERQKEKFLEGAKKKKIDKKRAEKIFDLMAKFAEYGFNKSHSTAYALISYQTAYLKAHYPLAFMSALMTCDAEDTDKIIRYIAELKEKKIPLLPPDINESFKDFTVSGNAIRFGLAAIKNLGESAIDSIIKAREEKGKFSSLLDFCEKVDLRKVNKRVIESLIKCGAFDFIGAHRSQLMAILDETIEVAQRIQRQKNGPQLGMFETFKEGVKDGINIPLPHLKEWPENQLLKYEREVLGFYLTSHPLIKFEEEIMRYTNSDTKSIVEMKSGDEIKIGGIINDVKVISTKKGDKMAFITIEDMKGFAEVILFPDTFQKYSKYIYGEEPVIVKGMINGEDERLKIKAQEIIPIEKIKERFVEKVHFMLQIPGLNSEYLNKFKDILIKNKGNTPSFVHMILPDKFEAIISLSENFNVSPNEKLIKELENLFGYNIVMFE
ncbi:MAG: DNA polymerase III subunit alpha, partial [Deltaproteobacteria bacterium]|nr:DNA polymerase III subunit alpha [Deltaproteobacteria bacterium]